MRWGTDTITRRVARAATVLLVGTAAVLVAAWAAPRTSEAVGTWVKSPPPVRTHTVTVEPRLQVGRAGAADASSAERLRSAREAGTAILDVGDRFTMLGLTCDVPAAEADIEVRLRTSRDGDDWSPWYAAPLEVVAEGDGPPRAFVDALWTGEGRLVEVCASAAGDDAPVALTGVELVALDTEGEPGVVAAVAGALRQVVATVSGVGLAPPAAAAVETPDWVTRAGWGADESLRTGDPVYATVKMAFVHHTAGGNTYTADQAPGIVRGIYVYHTQSLGWSDIGYNFLVDRYGTVYVGRYGGPAKGVVGAHAYGFNTGSTGISVMGNFTDAAPPTAAMNALAHLLAWKLEVHGLDPLGTARMVCGATRIYTVGETVTLPVISGHRDVNYTACPGDAFYPKLDSLRSAAAAKIKLSSVEPEPYDVTLALSAGEVAVDTPVTYSGTVKTAAGAPASGTVTVQKRLAPDGDWINWRTASLTSTGAYAVTVTMTSAPRDWQFRARMPGDGVTNLTGVSAIRDLHVAAESAALTVAQDTAFSITGQGSGHGIGMSQWGARGLAVAGSSYRDILEHYYTGIGFSDIGSPTVRVLLGSGLGAVKLTCPEDFTVRGSADAVTIPAETTATTTYVDGKYRVVAGGWSRDFSAPVTFTPTANRLTVLTTTDAGVTGPHRGTVRVVAAGGSLMMVNDVGMQSYLRGVVAHEMPASWPTAALEAQTCAARAYAERARLQGTGEFDLYCDARSQYYGGTAREDERTDAVVVATRGVVPTVGDEPIYAFYFSCSGGKTENIELAWQTGPQSYLKGVNDPYDDAAPLHTWGPLSRTAAQLEAALGTAVKGSLVAVCPVEYGVSPRIVKAAIVGTEGTTYLHGSTLRSKLVLSSSWATFTSMSIVPAAEAGFTVAPGASVTLEGRIYPGLADGAVVTLYSEVDGAWRGRDVTTSRRTQTLPDGYSTAYSTYSATVSPSQTTRYYFASGGAASPITTVTVRE